jgi:ATP-binding cassette subfamily C protein LapB
MSDPSSSIYECLRILLSFYDLDIDLEGVINELPHLKEMTGLEVASDVLSKLGFSTTPADISSPDLSKAELPTIITLENGEHALYMPSKTHGEDRIFSTKNNNKIVKTITSQNYSGKVLYIAQQKADTHLDTEHMKAGHALDWFWGPVARYRGRYAEILLSSLFINLLILAVPLYTLNVYDRVVINFAEETLIVLTTGVCIALIFDFIFKTLRSYILERVAEDLGQEYDFDLMERLFRIRPTELNLSIGEQANIFRELQGIREFYSGRLVPTLVDVPFVLLFIYVIYLLCPPLALVPLFISLTIIVANFAVHIPIKRLTENYFLSIQNKSSLLIETLAGMETTKMFNSIASKLLKWDIAVNQAARTSRSNYFMMGAVSNFSMMLTQLGHVMVIFFGVYQIEQTNLTIGGLIACTILSGRALGPIVNLSGVISRLKQFNDVLNVIDKFFKLPYEDAKDAQKSAKGPFEGEISIKQVSFQYASQSNLALDNINLEIIAGESVGLIGKTAAGKSTLAKVVAGILGPQQGTVALDGYDYNAISAMELRRSIAYVPQDAFMFRGTVRHNILLGREDISEEALELAIKISGLDLVIHDTSQGLDTEVGEFGCRLSGGQKQAISLARAVVREPRVIVFDEPTTGMDNMLEQKVRQELEQYIKDKTFIMVTHRTTLLPLVERLILLDRGKVLADGPRDEILAKISG